MNTALICVFKIQVIRRWVGGWLDYFLLCFFIIIINEKRFGFVFNSYRVRLEEGVERKGRGGKCHQEYE